MIKNNINLCYRSSSYIKKYQEERLKDTLEYVANNSPFYRRLFSENKVDIKKVKTIEDLQLLPTISKSDLQLCNMDFLCVEPSKIIDYVTTSGTLGEPVVFALTENDLRRLAYNEASSFAIAGLTKDDVMQIMTTIDRRFMAGLAYFMGARQIGCGIVRVGNGIPELQWDTINRVKSTVCVVVPSFLLKMVEFAENNNIDLHSSSLKKAVCIGEAIRTPDGELTTLGKKITKKWPSLELYSTYASTEMQTSFTECELHNGNHILSDLIIVELLDDNNQPVEDGIAGEVTITTLGVEAMPLVRFKTGDICIRFSKKCSCGRNSSRLSSVIGRRGQMIKFKGTTIYPPVLYDILDGIPEIEGYIVQVFTNELGTDQIQIRVASCDTSDSFAKKIKDIFRSRIRAAPDIKFEPLELIIGLQSTPINRKVVKFIDLRNNI